MSHFVCFLAEDVVHSFSHSSSGSKGCCEHCPARSALVKHSDDPTILSGGTSAHLLFGIMSG